MNNDGFRIAARALRQLGAELITSDDIALNELIKNAFDARSKQVVVRVNYPFSLSQGKLLAKLGLKKNHGVPLFTVLKEFVHPSVTNANYKLIQELAEELESSPREAAIASLFERFCHIKVSDTGFGMDAPALRDSFMVIGTPAKWKEKQLGPDKIILGEKGIGRLSMMRLGQRAELTSGQKGESNRHRILFDWAKFDDPDKFIQDIEIPIFVNDSPKKETESGTTIVINDLLDHWDKEKVVQFAKDYLRRIQNPFVRTGRYPVKLYFNSESIEIGRLPKWVIDCANLSASVVFDPAKHNGKQSKNVLTRNLRWHGSETDDVRTQSMEDLVRQLECDADLLQSIGPLKLDILWFNRGPTAVPPQDVNYSAQDLRTELNHWIGGYAIYRDGFRIGVTGSLEDDWLKMDSTALRSKGYVFNRYQTIASISITSKDNPRLIDSANREGLISVPEYELLVKLVSNVINLDLKAEIDHVKSNSAKELISENASKENAESITERLGDVIEKVQGIQKKVPSELRPVLGEFNRSLTVCLESSKRLSKEVELSRESRIEVLELAGMGSVLDKVAHELSRLTDQIAKHLIKLEREEFGGDSSDIISVMRAQIEAVNKRIRTIDRLSPSARLRREKFSLSGLLNSLLEGYEGRFERHEVDSLITINGVESDKNVEVNMVYGLVPQIIENLLDNSIYWMDVSRENGSPRGQITIDIDTTDKTLRFTDNGAGIDPANAERIMRPYITMKKKGKGLGLFIARELASHHDVNFYLDTSSVSDDGKLRSFVLELVF